MKLKIEEYRKNMNLSQKELAEKVGCSRQYINMLENGHETNVSSKLLLNLASVLNVKVEELFILPISQL